MCRLDYTAYISGLTTGKPKDLELGFCDSESGKCDYEFDGKRRGEDQRFVSVELDLLTVGIYEFAYFWLYHIDKCIVVFYHT